MQSVLRHPEPYSRRRALGFALLKPTPRRLCQLQQLEAAWGFLTYCDHLAGEVPWVLRTIKKYHDEAAAKRVKIVHMCGFDSIPSDLGSHMVATAMFKKHKR